MEKQKLIKIFCIVLFVITAIFILVSFSSGWRLAALEKDSSYWLHYDLFGGVSTVFQKEKKDLEEKKKEDDKAGIVRGWTGDKAVAALFILAFILYIINIFAIVISMVARAFPEKAAFIHPILCFIATFFMIIACIVFGVNKTDKWVWYPSTIYKNVNGSSPVVEHAQGYAVDKSFKDSLIHSNTGVYIAVVAIILSIVSIVLSAAAILLGGRLSGLKIGAGGGASAPPPPPPPPPPPAQGQGALNLNFGFNAAAPPPPPPPPSNVNIGVQAAF